MADSTDLIEKIIDLKIERAVAVVLAEVQKLGDAHNHLAQTVVPPLVADLQKRQADAERSKDEQIKERNEQIAALQQLLADATGKPATTQTGIVIPPSEGQ